MVRTTGPLAGETFEDAERLEVVIEAQGEQQAATVPFVIVGTQLLWLADCPPEPEPTSGTNARAPRARHRADPLDERCFR